MSWPGSEGRAYRAAYGGRSNTISWRCGRDEVRNGLVQFALLIRDQAQIVVTIGVLTEAVDQEPENGFGLLVFPSFVEAHRVFFGVRGYVLALELEAPVKRIIGIPLVRFLIAQLQAPVDELGDVFELVPMLLNDAGRREQFLRIGLDELAGEGTQILAEPVLHPRAVVLVPLWQNIEILLDVVIDFFPAELELRKPPLQ